MGTAMKPEMRDLLVGMLIAFSLSFVVEFT